MQPPKVSDWLDALWASLPGCLCSEAMLAAQLKAASVLPALHGGASLEFHLCGPSQVDLFFRFLLSDRDALGELGAPDFLREVFRRWSDPRDVLHTMPFVDVGIDVGETSGPPFAGLTIESIERGLRRIGLDPQDRSRRGRSLARADAAAELVDGTVAMQRLRPVLERCHGALPPCGSLHYISSLDARKRGNSTVPALRIIVTLPSGALKAYLQDVGWPGDVESSLSELWSYVPTRGETSVDLDLLEEGPTARLAAYVDFHRPRANDRTLCRTLETLTRMPHARVALLDGAMDWASRGLRVCRELANHWALTIKAIRHESGTMNARIYFSLINSERADGQPTFTR